MTEINNRWPEIIKQFDELNRLRVAIGFFSDDEKSKMLTIVRANEFGAYIRPIHGEWLTIPTKDTPMGDDGGPMPARQIPGLFRPKGKNILAVSDGAGGLTVMYMLVKEVVIPSRPFIRTALFKNRDKYQQTMIKGVRHIIEGSMTARQVLTIIGEQAKGDIIRETISWDSPGNMPATVARKGTNDPLVDKGILQRSVKYKILEGWHD